ncbi:MAG: hypothetical protein NTV10_03515 [Methanoregula sp.]|nr:hypothetical protein [Methanoregula sp.]
MKAMAIYRLDTPGAPPNGSTSTAKRASSVLMMMSAISRSRKV